MKTLYVHRPLLNPEDLIEWATHQGFPATLAPHDMHVTVAFSKKPFHWHHISPHTDEIHVVGDKRHLNLFGENKDTTVLLFHHPRLHHRWNEFLSHGASWDHEGYRPHVSLTYEPHGIELKSIRPYDGPLVFGPEKFAPVKLDWDELIKEIPLVAENRAFLSGKTNGSIKYGESIMENNRMTESLASLLMKNIDLILEAYNVDEKGNLVEVNKKKVVESDDIFHKYFVKSMNQMFRTINEADPILHDPNNMMAPMGGMNGMHGMDGGMEGGGMHGMHGMHGGMDGSVGEEFGDEGLGQAGLTDMTDGMNIEPDASMYGDAAAHHGMEHGHMGHDQMGGGMGGGGMGGGAPMGESADYDWVFGEEADLDVDALFNLTEEDDEEEEAVEEGEGDEDDETLNEFGMGGMMGHGAEQMGGSMDLEGGHNDFGGDMGSDMDSGLDHMGGDMGGEEGEEGDLHLQGKLDDGRQFEFEITDLDFGGGDEGGGDFGGGAEDHGSEEHHGHEPDMGSPEEDENPMAEAAGRTPGKGNRGKKTARMGIVPAKPDTKNAAVFPSPPGSRQKR